MSRPLRIAYAGAGYPIMNRGRGRATTFPEKRAYPVLLATVAEAPERFRREVHAYCLMPNHYHLSVRICPVKT
jgi:putative transposase